MRSDLDNREIDNLFGTGIKMVLRAFDWALVLVPLMLLATFIEVYACDAGVRAVGKATGMDKGGCMMDQRRDGLC